MGSLPLRFWVTTGIGIHPEHQINAYDQALYMAGISEQNIIAVSSVPPEIQVIPKIINGLTYVPVLDKLDDEKIHMFDTVEIEGKKHFVLKNSWCINVVLARSDDEQFKRITSSIGLGWYKTLNGYGIYAVEDHGGKTAKGSIDNCVEMLDRMMQFRGVKPIDDEPSVIGRNGTNTVSEPIVLQEDTKKYLAEKAFYTSHRPKQRIYTITMDSIPEGYVATAIALVVMDPFTEIHS